MDTKASDGLILAGFCDPASFGAKEIATALFTTLQSTKEPCIENLLKILRSVMDGAAEDPVDQLYEKLVATTAALSHRWPEGAAAAAGVLDKEGFDGSDGEEGSDGDDGDGEDATGSAVDDGAEGADAQGDGGIGLHPKMKQFVEKTTDPTLGEFCALLPMRRCRPNGSFLFYDAVRDFF